MQARAGRGRADLERVDIERAMAGVRANIHRCVLNAGTTSTTARLLFAIESDGRVHYVAVESYASPEVRGCIAREMRTLRVRRTGASGAVVVSYPLRF